MLCSVWEGGARSVFSRSQVDEAADARRLGGELAELGDRRGLVDRDGSRGLGVWQEQEDLPRLGRRPEAGGVGKRVVTWRAADRRRWGRT